MAAPTNLAMYEALKEALYTWAKAGCPESMKVNGWEITTASAKLQNELLETFRLKAIQDGDLKANLNSVPVNVSRALQRTYQPYGIMG